MTLAFDHPWLLLLLLLCLPALRGAGADWRGVSSLAIAPIDAASRGLDALLRVLAAGATAAIVLGLAGLHRPQLDVQRTGEGAHIILVLDRSLSMDEPFALAGEKAKESKTQAAAGIIADFFARRPHDEFGLVAFSTSPILAMPLTEHREAIAGALAAMRQKGLANTDIGGALSLALSMFAHDAEEATRVLLFVSDGAAIIEPKVQDHIREQALRQRAHIYYLYLRAGDEPALAEDISNHHDGTHPAALSAFFAGLGVPYRGFEATDPDAVAAAAAVIGRLETHPIAYREKVPRLDLDGVCYAASFCCLVLVLLARLAERDFASHKKLSPPRFGGEGFDEAS